MTQPISALRALVVKDLRILMRAKASALVVILGPLLLILLAGLAFDNTNLYAVNIGVYSEQYSTVSDHFIGRLSESEFKVTKFLSEDDCVAGIKRGSVHVCAVFAPDFKIAINGSNVIDFYVDYSRLNLVNTILETITKRISSRSLELSRNLTLVLVNALERAKAEARRSRPIIVDLTTENEKVSSNLATLHAIFSELELNAITPADMGIDGLTSKKNRVRQWIDAQSDISGQTLTEARKFVIQAYGLTKDAGVADIAELYNDSMITIDELASRLNTTNVLVEQDFSELSALIDQATTKLGIMVSQMDSMVQNKQSSLEDIESARQSLESALLKILELQKSLNEIESDIAGIEVSDPDAITKPIISRINPVSADQSYLNYIFPLLIALVIMFTALLLGPTLVLLERGSPAHTRHLLAPIPDWLRVTATYLSTMSVLGIQVLVVLIIAASFFSWQVLSSLHISLIAFLLLMTLFTLIGMIIGYIFQNETTAMLVSTALGSILLLFSNVFVPIERLPPYLLSIAQYNPFVLAGDLVRRIIVHHAEFSSLLGPLLILAVMCVFAAVITLLSFAENRTQKLSEAAKTLLKRRK